MFPRGASRLLNHDIFMLYVSCHLLGLTNKFQVPTTEEMGPFMGKTANGKVGGGKSEEGSWQVRESEGLLSTHRPFLRKVLLSPGLGVRAELAWCCSLSPGRRELARWPAGRGWPWSCPPGHRNLEPTQISINWLAAPAAQAEKFWLVSLFS